MQEEKTDVFSGKPPNPLRKVEIFDHTGIEQYWCGFKQNAAIIVLNRQRRWRTQLCNRTLCHNQPYHKITFALLKWQVTDKNIDEGFLSK